MNDNLKYNSLFTQDWWWDAVCPPENRHEIELKDKQGTLRGLWRMAKVRRLGIFDVYTMPPLRNTPDLAWQTETTFCRSLRE